MTAFWSLTTTAWPAPKLALAPWMSAEVRSAFWSLPFDDHVGDLAVAGRHLEVGRRVAEAGARTQVRGLDGEPLLGQAVAQRVLGGEVVAVVTAAAGREQGRCGNGRRCGSHPHDRKTTANESQHGGPRGMKATTLACQRSSINVGLEL